MTDNFERDLAAALKSEAPAPRDALDPAQIIASRRTKASWRAPVFAAIVVIALAASLTWLVRRKDEPTRQALATVHPTAQVSSGSPQPTPGGLRGSWVLTDLRGFAGADHTEPNAPLIFDFRGDGIVSQDCAVARVAATSEEIVFRQNFVEPTTTGCPARLSIEQARFLFGDLLTGRARWELSDSTLRISHAGAAAAFRPATQEDLDNAPSTPTCSSSEQPATELHVIVDTTLTPDCLYAPANTPLRLRLTIQGDIGPMYSKVFVSPREQPACGHAMASIEGMGFCSSADALFSTDLSGSQSDSELDISSLSTGTYVIQLAGAPSQDATTLVVK